MNRLLTCVSFSMMVLLCLSTGADCAQNRGNNVRSQILEGAYEFVSEKVVLTESLGTLPPPDMRSTTRTSEDWEGRWLFTDGCFSTIMMKKARPNFPSDLGYEATGGKYSVKGTSVNLEDELMLSPLERVLYHSMEFKLEGSTLTLVETFHPSVPHIAYGGKRTIVLRRIRSR